MSVPYFNQTLISDIETLTGITIDPFYNPLLLILSSIIIFYFIYIFFMAIFNIIKGNKV